MAEGALPKGELCAPHMKQVSPGKRGKPSQMAGLLPGQRNEARPQG